MFQIFGAACIVAVIYATIILYKEAKRKQSFEQSIKMRFLFYGFSAFIILMLGNILPHFGIKMYPPGNFGFIPLGLIAYGILQHQLLDAPKNWFLEGYISKMLAYLAWAPFAVSLLFWFFAPSEPFISIFSTE